MARGQKCPQCGRLTLHAPVKGTGAATCSKCGARAWHHQAVPKGAGRGDECNICGNHTYRVIANLGTVLAFYCSTCEATALAVVKRASP